MFAGVGPTLSRCSRPATTAPTTPPATATPNQTPGPTATATPRPPASILSQLASQVAPLQSEWQGVAQARFQELWAEWQRSSRGIQEALHGISQLTQQAGTNYADTEQGIASSFGRSGPPDPSKAQTSTTTGSTMGRRLSRS